MDLEEFETQYRNAIDEILNQLQTVNLLASQIQIRVRSLDPSNDVVDAIARLALEVETRVLEIGTSTQTLSFTIERFISEQQ